MQSRIHPAQRHGARGGSVPLGVILPPKAEREFRFGYGLFIVHLFPKGGVVVFHPHDAVGQLRDEKTGDGDLTSEVQFECELCGLDGVDVIAVEFVEGRGMQGIVVRSAGVTKVQAFVGRPAGPLGVRHGYFASFLFGTGHGGAEPPHALIAGCRFEGRAVAFLEVGVGVVGIAAALAFLAGEGRDARAGVDYDGLSLGSGCAHPQVDVVRAVSLVERSHLLLERSAVGGAQGGGDGGGAGGDGMPRLHGAVGQGGVDDFMA